MARVVSFFEFLHFAVYELVLHLKRRGILIPKRYKGLARIK
jgi:hypothetical protein